MRAEAPTCSSGGFSFSLIAHFNMRQRKSQESNREPYSDYKTLSILSLLNPSIQYLSRILHIESGSEEGDRVWLWRAGSVLALSFSICHVRSKASSVLEEKRREKENIH